VHNGVGVSSLGRVPIVNPGSLRCVLTPPWRWWGARADGGGSEQRFGLVQLERTGGHWRVAAVELRTLQ
jgi:hypothetical protein